jgi:hypothetical protein
MQLAEMQNWKMRKMPDLPVIHKNGNRYYIQRNSGNPPLRKEYMLVIPVDKAMLIDLLTGNMFTGGCSFIRIRQNKQKVITEEQFKKLCGSVEFTYIYPGTSIF